MDEAEANTILDDGMTDFAPINMNLELNKEQVEGGRTAAAAARDCVPLHVLRWRPGVPVSTITEQLSEPIKTQEKMRILAVQNVAVACLYAEQACVDEFVAAAEKNANEVVIGAEVLRYFQTYAAALNKARVKAGIAAITSLKELNAFRDKIGPSGVRAFLEQAANTMSDHIAEAAAAAANQKGKPAPKKGKKGKKGKLLDYGPLTRMQFIHAIFPFCFTSEWIWVSSNVAAALPHASLIAL